MKFIKEIDDWLRKTGWADSRLGMLATANARAVARIRDGSARVSTLTAVLKFIYDHPASRTR